MKLTIHKEKMPEPAPVRLALIQDSDCPGAVKLVVVKEDGRRDGAGWILSVQPDGTVYMAIGVNPKFGFRRNKTGAVVVSDKMCRGEDAGAEENVL